MAHVVEESTMPARMHAAMAVALFAAMAAQAQTKPAQTAQTKLPGPLTHWADPATGVSLDYPTVWKRTKGSEDYCPAVAFEQSRGVPEHAVPVRFAAVFSPESNVYAQTTLESLAFLFGTMPHSTPAACRQFVGDMAGAPQNNLTIGGVPYAHSSAGECGLSHSITAEIYTTFRNGSCYVFEEDFDESTGRLGEDGTRELTAAERRALRRHLHGILQSVRIASPAGK
jgi:hypothetical protein